MTKEQIISRLQLLWRKSVTDQFTPTSQQMSSWLNTYRPLIIRDAIQVLAKFLKTRNMRGDECILYLCATMRNMKQQRGDVDFSKFTVGHAAPEEEEQSDDEIDWDLCNSNNFDVG
jgi:hypothetical protein